MRGTCLLAATVLMLTLRSQSLFATELSPLQLCTLLKAKDFQVLAEAGVITLDESLNAAMEILRFQSRYTQAMTMAIFSNPPLSFSQFLSSADLVDYPKHLPGFYFSMLTMNLCSQQTPISIASGRSRQISILTKQEEPLDPSRYRYIIEDMRIHFPDLR